MPTSTFTSAETPRPRAGEGAERSAAGEGPSLSCPRCGAVARPDDVFCEIDGTRLAGPEPVSPSSAAGACPCGAAEDDGDGYCARCGHQLAPAHPAAFLPDHAEIEVDACLAAVTDRGLRHWRNEDAVALAREQVHGAPVLMAVVCDGVSSSTNPDQASTLVAGTVRDALLAFVIDPNADDPRSAMAAAIRAAHDAACATEFAPKDSGDPPGTTVVAALLREGRLIVGWVGDSRAYWVGAAGEGLLTRDHSWVNDMVDQGTLTAADAMRSPYAHALTRCLGPLEQSGSGAAPEPSLVEFTPPTGCLLVLCSDGLWNYADAPSALAALVRALPDDATALTIAQALTRHALAGGGHDNITVAVARLP